MKHFIQYLNRFSVYGAFFIVCSCSNERFLDMPISSESSENNILNEIKTKLSVKKTILTVWQPGPLHLGKKAMLFICASQNIRAL
mgnify:CR=1 FL=1